MKRPQRLLSWYGLHDGLDRKIKGWTLLFSLDTTFAVQVRKPDRSSADRLPEAIYAGLYFSQFGHFMTETVPNLAAAQHLAHAHPTLPIVMHLAPADSVEALARPEATPFLAWFMEKLGIDWHRLKFVTQPLCVDTLHVPASPFSGKFRYAKAGIDALDRVFGAPGAARSDVYLSRSRWPNGRLLNETEVEEVLSARGFEIVHMQDLSLDAQLSCVQSARRVVGPQGTALHWSLFSQHTDQVISLGFRSPLQKGISRAREQTYHEVGGTRPKGAGYRDRHVPLDRLEARLG